MPDHPLAYFTTFRCHGTWLPGDARGFTAIGDNYGTPHREPHRGLAGDAHSRMKTAPVALDSVQRRCVEQAIATTCLSIGWQLYAVNARTNHVHVVVSGSEKPERILNAIKSWSTRSLRAAGLLDESTSPWSRHGSTVYLWSESDVDGACTYVIEGQDKQRD